jgi:uncharacterized protein (TIGR02996 family)
MSDEKALLAAIWEHPYEDTPRLMYADWLDEQGGESNTARAELIRAQCTLDQLDGDDPRYDDLEKRAGEIRNKWEKAWRKVMPKGCKDGYHFERGFFVPHLGRFSIGGLVKLGKERLGAAPVWRYHYGVHGRDLDQLLAWPHLHRLGLFALRPPLPGDWAERLARCPNLRNVTELALIDCWVTADEMAVLLDAWAGRHLRMLRFDPAEDDTLRVLAGHPTAAGLRVLIIDESRLRAPALHPLVKSRHLRRLTDLTLDDSPFGDAGVMALLKWPGLAKLRALRLCQDRVTNAGARALAGCRALANLRELSLSDNRIGATGARALAASAHLARLQDVSLYDTPAMDSEPTRALLRARFPDSAFY